MTRSEEPAPRKRRPPRQNLLKGAASATQLLSRARKSSGSRSPVCREAPACHFRWITQQLLRASRLKARARGPGARECAAAPARAAAAEAPAAAVTGQGRSAFRGARISCRTSLASELRVSQSRHEILGGYGAMLASDEGLARVCCLI